MTAPASESTSQAEPTRQPDPVVGVNDWHRVSVAWERVFDDVTEISADLKAVFKDAYHDAAVDPGADLSDAVSGLGAEQFVGVSERLDRGLAGARAAMSTLGQELHEGGTDRIHGEVEGAVKVSLYELGMLLIRMSDKLDGDVPPPRPPRARAAAPPPEIDWHGANEAPVEPEVAPSGGSASADVVQEREDSTEEIPEIDLSVPARDPADLVTPAPESIPVRPASELIGDPPRFICPD